MLVREIWEYFASTSAGTEELIGVQREFIGRKYGTQTTFIKWAVVGYNRQIAYLGLDLVPYFGEDTFVLCVASGNSVYLCIKVIVKIRIRLYESVISVRYLRVFNKN